MPTISNLLPCDGCGLPATPEHIAERLKRLELSTRYRPVHVGMLFVALAPSGDPKDDFYGSLESRQFFNAFLDGLGITEEAGKAADGDDTRAASAKLAEFQHRGHYLAYVSECPLPQDRERTADTISRLAANLIRRIHFNYKPKFVVPLGEDLLPLVHVLQSAGLGPVVMLDQGQPLPIPRTGSGEWASLFQRAVASLVPR